MARTVCEIMNGELFGVRPDERIDQTLDAILTFGITAVPVLDDERRPLGVVSLRDLADTNRHGDRTTSPAVTIASDASIADAGRALAAANVHHLVVVDADHRAVGMVSALDVVRGLLGIPARHPRAFPHRAFGVSWSDDRALDAAAALEAPERPGVLVLSEGEPGRHDAILWVESCENLRLRLEELIDVPQTDAPLLARILARRNVRVRHAAVAAPVVRERVTFELREALAHQMLPQGAVPMEDS